MWNVFSLLFTLGYLVFLVTMLIDCYQREQDRGIWLLVMLFLHPLGAIVYFLTRFLPRGGSLSGGGLAWLRFQGGELKRLQLAARQIGNAYHWLQYADGLRSAGKLTDAEAAYRTALEKDPAQLQALWGLSLVLAGQKRFDEALELTERLLAVDADYKFGDVSLAKGRLLAATGRWGAAQEHLQRHIRRWRQPEGLYLLAQASVEMGDRDAARQHLEAVVMDIDASPPAIAAKQRIWKSKARRLLRSL